MKAEAEREETMKQEKAEKNEKGKWPNHSLNHQFSNSGQEAPHIPVIHVWYLTGPVMCVRREMLYIYLTKMTCAILNLREMK